MTGGRGWTERREAGVEGKRFQLFGGSGGIPVEWASFLKGQQPGQQAGQQDREGPRRAPPGGGAVSPAAKFKQTPAKIQTARFFLEFLPKVAGAFLAVGQRRAGARVEVVPVAVGGQAQGAKKYQK